MAVIDRTEFCSSRMMMGCCSIRLWIQGIVVLLLVVRGEFSSPANTAAAGKCELARVEFSNRGLLEAVLLSDLQDNVTNGESFSSEFFI